MTAAPPVTTALRVSALAMAVSGIAVLAVTGLLSGVAAGIGVILLAAAAAAPTRFVSPRGLSNRRLVARGVILTISVFTLFWRSRSGAPSDLSGALVEFGSPIAPLLVGVLIAQFLVTDRVRDVRVTLVLSGMAFVLALAWSPRPAVALTLLVGFLALVFACHEAHLATRRGKADVVGSALEERGSRAPWGQLAMLTAVAVGIAIAAATLIPPSEGITSRNRLGGQAGFGGSVSHTSQGYTSGVLDLRARGTLPDTPVLEVPAGSPRLWRGLILTDYDGTTWRAGRSDAWKTGGPAPAQPERRDVVRIREGFSGVLLAPGLPVRVEADGELQDVAGGYQLRERSGGRYPQGYAVTSSAAVPTAALREATGADLDPRDPTVRPPHLPTRVHDLARQLTADAATRYDAVLSVERYLAEHATYRLDSPVPPPGQDAVDHFLFEARTGFCMQFASAATVLLRSAGIPARLVTGFSGGTPTDDGRLLRAENAHAWVEVWYPGVGWVASDPTAGAQLADASGSWLARADALMLAVQRRSGLVAAVVAALVVVGLGVFWAVRRRRRAPAPAGAVSGRARSPVVAAFLRLETALERSGAPRAPAESLTELAARLPAGPPVTDALDVLARVCYAGRSPDVRAVQEAARVIDDVAAGLLADQSR